CSSAWLKFFGQNSWNTSLSYKGVTFISINTGDGWSSDTSNLDSDAAAAQARGDWIVVIYHKPIYTAKSSHSPDEGGIAGKAVPLIDKYGVALSLTGHNHNYQRSFPMKAGKPTITTGNNYNIIDGTVY